MRNVRELWDAALVTRPYSWVNTVLIGIASYYILTGDIGLSTEVALVGFLSLLMWVAGNSLPEFMRKTEEYDEETSRLYYVLPLLVLAGLSTAVSLATTVPLALLTVGLFLYGLKTRSRAAGRVSFLFRGISEVSLVLYVATVVLGAQFFNALPDASDLLAFTLAVYAVTGSRNLVGDLRDRSVDEHTLAVASPSVAKAASIGLALVPLRFYPLAVVFPVLAASALLLASPRRGDYVVHRMYIFATTVFVFNVVLATASSLQVTWVANLLLVSYLLNFTYDDVPRKLSKVKSE